MRGEQPIDRSRPILMKNRHPPRNGRIDLRHLGCLLSWWSRQRNVVRKRSAVEIFTAIARHRLRKRQHIASFPPPFYHRSAIALIVGHATRFVFSALIHGQYRNDCKYAAALVACSADAA
jgi:hypothetical protein